MTFRLLPHSFKKIGLVLFVGGSLPDVIRGATAGYSDFHYPGSVNNSSLLPLSGQTLWLLEMVSILGILLYAMAKDRVYDELFERLRLQALEYTFFITVVCITVAYFFMPTYRMHPSYLINLQLMVFLVIYYFKKQAITSAN